MQSLKYPLILLFFCWMNQVRSQTKDTISISKYEKAADVSYAEMNFIKAIINYRIVLKKDTFNQRVLPKLARSYYNITDYKNALRVYDTIIKYNLGTNDDMLAYAKLLAINKRYDEALTYYKKYDAANGSSNTKEIVKAYENLKQFYRDSTHKKVKLANINSESAEFSPMFYKDGLLFISNRTSTDLVMRVSEWNQTPFTNVFLISDSAKIKEVTQNDTIKIVYNDDNTYETSNDTKIGGFHSYSYNERDTTIAHVRPTVSASKFSKLNSKDHDGPFSFFSGQDSLILTRTNKQSDTNGVTRIALYKAISDDGKWKVKEQLEFVDEYTSYANPAISPDNKILYFVSDKKGGLGGTDIYKSTCENGKWSKPENVGAPINTTGNEQFPYVDTMGVLYFSSDGHPGLGGLDLFTYTNNKVENMGYPVNSNYDDFGITLDKTCGRGFFSSNRRRGYHDDDIFMIALDPKAPLLVRVVDSTTQVLIKHAKDTISISATKEIIQADSSATGEFSVIAWDGEKYEIVAGAQGYRTKKITVKMDVKNPIVTVPLVRDGCSVGGVVIDKDTRLPVPASLVTIYDTLSHDTVYRFYVGEDGKYNYGELKNNTVYCISVRKEAYYVKLPYYINTKINNKCLVPVDTGYNYNHDFELEKIMLGKAIKIDNIYFGTGKFNINGASARELDKIVVLMNDNPDIVIELSSHTDCRDLASKNMILSDKRAKSSASYIISRGIAAERVIGKGYGETRLINDCACEGKKITRKCSEHEHQVNRRTEFQVTGFLSKDTNKKIRSGEMDLEIKK